MIIPRVPILLLQIRGKPYGAPIADVNVENSCLLLSVYTMFKNLVKNVDFFLLTDDPLTSQYGIQEEFLEV